MPLAAALIPTFTKCLFAIKEHEPVRRLRFFFLTAKHSPNLEQRRDRRRRIVRAEKLHVLVIRGIVVARDQNYRFRLTGNLADDVCYLLLTLRRGRADRVEIGVQSITLQLVHDVRARLRELRSVRRAWSEVDLLAHVIHRAFTVESRRNWCGGTRLARTGRDSRAWSIWQILFRAGRKQQRHQQCCYCPSRTTSVRDHGFFARARFMIESKAFEPYASGFSIAASNVSDAVIASNCIKVAIFLPSGNAPNFFCRSAAMSVSVGRACGRVVTITTTSP